MSRPLDPVVLAAMRIADEAFARLQANLRNQSAYLRNYAAAESPMPPVVIDLERVGSDEFGARPVQQLR